MTRRTAWMLSAVGIALAILVASLWMGGEGGAQQGNGFSNATDDADAGTSNLRPILGGNSSSTAAGGNGSGNDTDGNSGGREGMYVFAQADRHIIMRYRTLSPLPNGAYEIAKPRALVYFSEFQVLEIRADEGTVSAPNDQLQRGRFDGNVVITLYDTGGDRPIDFQNVNDIGFRVYLDDAVFDVEANEIYTERSVHVTSNEADMRGTGLELIFNQRQGRLQRLVIFEGEELRFADSAEVPGNSDGPSSESAGGQTRPEVTKLTKPADSANATKPVIMDAEAWASRNRFRATFERDVKVDLQGDQVAIDAAKVRAFFLMGDEDGEESSLLSDAQTDELDESDTGLVSLSRSAISMIGEPSSNLMFAEPRELIQWGEDGEVQRSDEMRLTWVGRMLVEPAEIADGAELMPEWRNSEVVFSLMDSSALAGRQSTEVEPVQLVIQGDDPEDRDTLTASRVDYFLPAGVAVVNSSEAVPMRLESTSLGQLAGQRLVLNREQGTANITGPGRLETTLNNEDISKGSLVDDSLIADWNDTLELAFFQQGGDEFAALQQANFGGQANVNHPQFDLAGDQVQFHFEENALAISESVLDTKAGSFLQQVVVLADELGTGFGNGLATDSGHKRQWAKMRGRPNQEQPNQEQPNQEQPNQEQNDAAKLMDIRGEQLVIDFVRDLNDPDRPYPIRFTADGEVVATQPGMLMEAGQLEVAFVEQTAEPSPLSRIDTTSLFSFDNWIAVPATRQQRTGNTIAAKSTSTSMPAPSPTPPQPVTSFIRPEASDQPQIAAIKATQGIRAILEEQAVELIGHRMTIDPATEQLNLFGLPDDPLQQAIVRRLDGAIRGEHIVITRSTVTTEPETYANFTDDETKTTFTVLGPGRADLLINPDLGNEPSNQLVLGWDETMQFASDTGLIQFIGNASAVNRTPERLSKLTSNDLRVYLSEEQHTTLDANGNTEVQRNISLVQALGNAVFVGENVDAANNGEPLTRIRLEGPQLTMERATEELQVIGPGKLLIEDYRPASGTGNASSLGSRRTLAQTARSRQVAGGRGLTGRGATLFIWEDQLTLDASRNNLLIEDDVVMIHQPMGQPATERTQLDCQRLFADMEETGGLGVMMGQGRKTSASPKPQLSMVQADRGVRLIRGDLEALADHMQYTGEDQTAFLWADEGNLVRINDTRQASSLPGEAFKLNLATGRYEAIRPGSGVVPIQ